MIFETLRNAKQIFFNNQKSGLNANNVQDAIDAMGNVYYYTASGSPHSEVAANNIAVYVCRVGNLVNLHLSCTAQFSNTGNELTEKLQECVLPVGFRPAIAQNVTAASVISGAIQREVTRWILDADGSWIFNTNNALVYCERSCNLAYITEDEFPDESYLKHEPI